MHIVFPNFRTPVQSRTRELYSPNDVWLQVGTEDEEFSQFTFLPEFVAAHGSAAGEMGGRLIP